MADFELADPPRDGIACLLFHPTDPALLLAASWDKSLRVYDVYGNVMRAEFQTDTPLLTACWLPEDGLVCAGLDGRLYRFHLHSNVKSVTAAAESSTDSGDGLPANHPAPRAIRSLVYDSTTGKCGMRMAGTCLECRVLTGGWDAMLRSWSFEKDALDGVFQLVEETPLPGRVFAMSVSSGWVAVAMSRRHVNLYRTNSLAKPFQKRESALKFQTRSVAAMPDGSGFVISSIEGRVAVEYLDDSAQVQSKKYAFKCHRQQIQGQDYVYPVHAIAFHPKYGTFATGGGDGVVSIWDGFNKKRLRQYPAYASSVSALSFNADGTYLAVASSYCFEEGQKDHEPDSIFIKPVHDAEVRPKHLMATSGP